LASSEAHEPSLPDCETWLHVVWTLAEPIEVQHAVSSAHELESSPLLLLLVHATARRRRETAIVAVPAAPRRLVIRPA